MIKTILKPVNSFMTPVTNGKERGSFYLSGVLLEQGKKAMVIKVNKKDGYYYTFDISSNNNGFLIAKEDTLIFQIFKNFLESIISKYYLDMDNFAKRGIAKDFITKDKNGNIIIKFISELDEVKNIIYFIYTEQGIYIKSSQFKNSKLGYTGVEINSIDSKYANFFVEIQKLLDNLYNLMNKKILEEDKDNFNINEEFKIDILNNELLFHKNNQILAISRDNNDIVLKVNNANNKDLAFNIARKPLNSCENKIYQIFAKFLKHLFSEFILDKKEIYPKDFVNSKDKSIIVKNATGDTLTLNYSFDKISIDLKMGKRDAEAMDILAKYFDETGHEIERKMVIASKSYAYPNLNYEFQRLFEELFNVLEDRKDVTNILERRR